MTKLRIGLVTEVADIQDQMKKNLGDVYIYKCKTLYELAQNYGNQKLDAIVFAEGPQPGEADLQASLNFLRQKVHFKESLVFFLHQRSEFKLRGLLFDPLMRSYSILGGSLVPMLQLQSLATGTEAQLHREILNPEWLQSQFAQPLQNLIGQKTIFTCAKASEDEAHSSFFSQRSDEIASNLIWTKFTARILNEGSSGLREMFRGLSETEIEETTDGILNRVMDTFKTEVLLRLQDEGAVFLQGSDFLTAPERIELVKRGRPSTLVYKSTACSVLLEQILYT